MNPKLALHLPIMGQGSDRFTVYGVERSTAEKIELASQVKGLGGLEMVYPFEFEDIEEVKRLLKAYDLECASVNVNVKAEAKFHRGSFTSTDPEVRAEAVRYLEKGMDVAAAMGCYIATVCPLADGHDYPFEVDYGQAWRWLREGIAEAVQYRSDVEVSLEYKSSEARAHVVPSTAGVALHLCHQIGLPRPRGNTGFWPRPGRWRNASTGGCPVGRRGAAIPGSYQRQLPRLRLGDGSGYS